MKLTPEEFAAVAVYEKQLQVAVRSKYLRNVGRSGLAVLVSIYERVSSERCYVNPNCGPCILGFLQRIGAIYFADKTEQGAAAAEATTQPQQTSANEPRKRAHKRNH